MLTKLLKLIIFSSILRGIFFVINRQSDRKGLRRWRKPFELAAVIAIAASTAGSIPVNLEAIEPLVKSNQACHERDSEKIFEITLCASSDFGGDSDDDSAKNSFFAEGFSPNALYRRPDKPQDNQQQVCFLRTKIQSR